MFALEQRIKKINHLESIILKESIEAYSRHKQIRNAAVDNTGEGLDSFNLTSPFTRLWLNYLSDSQLEEILSRKKQA